jgi:succinoglycan biosynthesis transport protein ExoP
MSSGVDVEPQELHHYFRALKRRWWVIVLLAALVAAAAYALSSQRDSVYEANADVLVATQTAADVAGQARNRADEQRAVDTQIQLIEAQSTSDAASTKLDGRYSVDVSQNGDSDVVTITARAASANLAARIANTYAAVYVDERSNQAIEDVATTTKRVQDQYDALEKRRQELQGPIDNLSGQIASASGDARAQLLSQRATLEASSANELNSIANRQQLLAQQLNQLGIAASAGSATSGRLVSEALPQSSPSSPKPARDAAIAAVVTLILGLAFLFIRDRFSNRLQSSEDLEAASELHVLGSIPRVRTWKDRNASYLVSVEAPRSDVSEAYRLLRTSLQFACHNENIRTLNITSAMAGEGKTTLATNLAVAYARVGTRVVIVDCDLRRPRVHQFFGITDDIGLADVVQCGLALPLAVQQISDPKVAVLPSGRPKGEPSEVLARATTGAVISALAERFDVVLLDSPPLNLVSDAAILAHMADASILVGGAGIVSRDDVAEAVGKLVQVDATIMGAVLNGSRDRRHERDYYHYELLSQRVSSNGHEKSKTSRRHGKKAGASGATGTA